MDAKITLSFDKAVIRKAKDFAAEQGISLSRLTEFIYSQMTSGHYKTLDDLPVSDWVSMVAEDHAEYTKSKSRKDSKSEFFESKK